MADNPQCAQQARKQAEEQDLRERMGEIGFKMLVLSGKGGVGKSTVASNLAVSMAQAGKNVGLLDIDVHGPSIPKLLGLEGHLVAPSGDRILPVEVSDSLKVMSIGFLLIQQGQPVIWRGPMKYGVIRQFLKDVEWGPLDFLIIDSPPGTGDEPLSVAQLVGQPAGAVIVTTPQALAISDVRRCISFCNALSLPVLGVVENMSGFTCPHCGKKTDLFKAGGGKALATETGIPLLGEIPIDPQLVAMGDSGKPITAMPSDAPVFKSFRNIVQKLLEMQPEAK